MIVVQQQAVSPFLLTEMAPWFWALVAVSLLEIFGMSAAGEEELLDVHRGTTPKLLWPKSHAVVARAASKELNAFLVLLNDDFSYGRRFQTFLWGSPITIEARLDSAVGEPVKVYVDECYGAPTANLRASGKTYAMIHNHGCLVDGKFGNSSFWSRTNDSIVFTVQAFMLTDHSEEQVYIHCSLGVGRVTTPVGLERKSCSYNHSSSRWQLLEDPALSALCGCCNSSCISQPAPGRGDADPEHSEALYHVTLGPLTVRKRQSDWWEEHYRSLRRFLLACSAFVGSCLLGAVLTGILLACAVTVGSYCRRRKTTGIPESPYPMVLRQEKGVPVDGNENDQPISHSVPSTCNARPK